MLEARTLLRAAQVAMFVLCHAGAGADAVPQDVLAGVAQAVALPAVHHAEPTTRAAGLRLLAVLCVSLAAVLQPFEMGAVAEHLAVLVRALERELPELRPVAAEGLFDVVMACPLLQAFVRGAAASHTTSV